MKCFTGCSSSVSYWIISFIIFTFIRQPNCSSLVDLLTEKGRPIEEENTNKLLTHEDNGDNDDIADETPEMTDPKAFNGEMRNVEAHEEYAFLEHLNEWPVNGQLITKIKLQRNQQPILYHKTMLRIKQCCFCCQENSVVESCRFIGKNKCDDDVRSCCRFQKKRTIGVIPITDPEMSLV